MAVTDLVKALRALRVERGSLACLGCGYEHNCGIHGCAIIREAAVWLERLNDFDQTQSAHLLKKINALEEEWRWTRPDNALPPEDELVLVVAYGKPRTNVKLVGALMMATWISADGWVLEEFPEAEHGIQVTHWMRLPEPPEVYDK